MLPTTAPSTSVIARSVRGITSPSIENPVRPSRRATLNEGHPMYASFPIRRARFSPTRCQYWIVPSTPSCSLMSWMRDTRATSSIVRILLEAIRRRPPTARGGDAIASFEAREGLAQDVVRDPEVPPKFRDGPGAVREKSDQGLVGRRLLRRHLSRGLRGEGALHCGEAHLQGLDGLPGRHVPERRPQVLGEVLDVLEGSGDVRLEAIQADLEGPRLVAPALDVAGPVEPAGYRTHP